MSSGGPYMMFKITPKAAQMARVIVEKEKKEPPDLVEQVRLSVRRHPVTAVFIMAIVGVVFVATAINQIVGALRALKLIE